MGGWGVGGMGGGGGKKGNASNPPPLSHQSLVGEFLVWLLAQMRRCVCVCVWQANKTMEALCEGPAVTGLLGGRGGSTGWSGLSEA